MLKINNLTVRYNRLILDNVDVNFTRGTLYVIRGASGSGKLSLLNILGLIQSNNKECTYYFDSKKLKSESLIEYVGLKQVENNYCTDLSGGEEQRVAIARALINDADIILADEPVASLDNENRENILNLFSKLAHELNKIVIIVSHDNFVGDQADVLYEIKNKLFSFINFYSKNRKVNLIVNKC
ncbi:MAG: ATP-binding cassette domain-containing protein [Clostridiales bacterium]|nr:ATP-binding cassette domain-containing protein [Clostridiales bacterium]